MLDIDPVNKVKFLSIFFLLFTLQGCFGLKIKNDDKFIQDSANIIVDEKVLADSNRFQEVKESLSENPEKGKETLRLVKEYYVKESDDMDISEKISLSQKIHVVEEEFSVPEPEPEVRFDEKIERLVAIGDKLIHTKPDKKSNIKTVYLEDDNYEMIKTLIDNPAERKKEKEKVETLKKKNPEMVDELQEATILLEELDQHNFKPKSEEIKVDKNVFTVKNREVELITDKDLKVTFILPEDKIVIGKNSISVSMSVSQSIHDNYAIVLRDFTLTDKDKNPEKYRLKNNENIISLVLKKNKPLVITFEFVIPEDEEPEDEISFSFNFENYVYLFKRKI